MESEYAMCVCIRPPSADTRDRGAQVNNIFHDGRLMGLYSLRIIELIIGLLSSSQTPLWSRRWLCDPKGSVVGVVSCFSISWCCSLSSLSVSGCAHESFNIIIANDKLVVVLFIIYCVYVCEHVYIAYHKFSSLELFSVCIIYICSWCVICLLQLHSLSMHFRSWIKFFKYVGNRLAVFACARVLSGGLIVACCLSANCQKRQKEAAAAPLI